MRHFLRLTMPLGGVLLLGNAGSLASQRPLTACNVYCIAQRARDALAEHRYADYLTEAQQLVARAPDLPLGAYMLARANALTGQNAAAISQLMRAADIGATQDPASDSIFAVLREEPAYREVQSRLMQNRVPVVRGTLAFSVPDPDFIPEALARDPRSGSWLLGSLAGRKLVQLTPGGSARDFVTGARLLRVVGIHVDSARSLLWFATWAPRVDGQASGGAVRNETRLFRCDLATGRVLRDYTPSDSGGSHLFNDLALAENGDVFVTDTDRGWIYRVGSSGDSLEVFLRPDSTRFAAANGITISTDQRALYVGFLEGIVRIDLRTRVAERLALPGRGSTAGVDGLYYYDGSLIAVQHRPGLEQVARFQLSPDGRSIMGSEVLERGTSIMNLPTTGTVVGDLFYYIASSHADRLGQDNRLAPPGTPSERSTVRVIDLKQH